MELTWEWRGYFIGIKMVKERRNRRRTCSSATQFTEELGTHRYEDNIWRDHITAAGPRNVGPMR